MSRRSEDDHGPDINGDCARCGTRLGRGLIDERLAVWQRLRAEASQEGAL